ncbi:MAG TPA: dienelactone hydrolase family protein [Candidatus Limnocylindria bacterium]|nr:dienelactone hydrolase family protein [Candidatus Limnocylindria bacterium]
MCYPPSSRPPEIPRDLLPMSGGAGDRMRVPVLGLFGGPDKGIPESAVEQFRKALADRGVRHHIEVYPGAPHSFLDRTFADPKKESDDSWRRVLGSIRTGDPAARA